MSIELIFLSSSINFVAFSNLYQDLVGQVFVFFILTITAAEAAVGLAIILIFFRIKDSIHIDDINFLFSANPDQKLAPLSNVISGGEMSRFLLAIKSSISKKPNTFFLDEIDSGLSGKSLFSLVELIKEISKNQQVLCITHQPFLAARGSAHFKVNKNVIDGITYTSIVKLTTKNQRKNELIELIGGGSCEVNEYASRLLDRSAA